jgi:hypothetical protein
MSLKKFFKEFWKVLVFIFLIMPIYVYAFKLVDGGIKLEIGDTGTINLGGVNYTLQNTNSLPAPLFIPTHTQKEIDSFVSSAIGLTILRQ